MAQPASFFVIQVGHCTSNGVKVCLSWKSNIPGCSNDCHCCSFVEGDFLFKWIRQRPDPVGEEHCSLKRFGLLLLGFDMSAIEDQSGA